MLQLQLTAKYKAPKNKNPSHPNKILINIVFINHS